MAWPYSVAVNWALGQEPTKYSDQPVDADTKILAGMPLGYRAGSSPANCVRPCVAADTFAGFAVRDADNTLANAAAPNILNGGNFGDGTTGAGGAKVRVVTEGTLRFDGRVPTNTGVAGSIQGLVGTQADQDVAIYYNGTGFTTTSGGNTKVGIIAQVGTTPAGVTFWDLAFRADQNRNS